MINDYTEILLRDKSKLMAFIKDFGDEEIFKWCNNVLNVLTKKALTLNNVCIVGKLTSGLNNLLYYFKEFREDEDCLHYLTISLYIIGLQVDVLHVGNPVEEMKFFFECIDETNWKEDVSADLESLNYFDMSQNFALYGEWTNGEDLTLRPIGLNTASCVSVYLNYKY